MERDFLIVELDKIDEAQIRVTREKSSNEQLAEGVKGRRRTKLALKNLETNMVKRPPRNDKR